MADNNERYEDDADRVIAESTRGYPRPLIIWVLVLVFVVLGAILVFVAPERILQNWLPTAAADERAKLLGTAAQIVLFTLGGAIAVVGVALSLSRHRQEIQTSALEREKEKRRRQELANQLRLDAERELRTRFVTAVELLAASDSPTRRTAAFYSLSAIADEWDVLGRDDEVQVCVDVICGYLRSATSYQTDEDRRLEIEVRTTAARIVRAHLIESARNSWSDRVIDLSGILLDYLLDLAGAVISANGNLSLARVNVTDEGVLALDELKLEGDALASLSDVVVEHGGQLSLSGAKAESSATLRAVGAEVRTGGAITIASLEAIDSATVSFDGLSVLDTGRFYATGVKVSGSARVTFDNGAIASDGILNLEGVHVSTSGRLSLDPIEIGASGAVSLSGARVQDDGRISVASTVDGVRGVLSVEDVVVRDAGRMYIDARTSTGQGSVLVGTNDVEPGSRLMVNGETPSPSGFLLRTKRDATAAGGTPPEG